MIIQKNKIAAILLITLSCGLMPTAAICQAPLTLDQYLTQHIKHAPLQMQDNHIDKSLKHEKIDESLILSDKYIGRKDTIKKSLKQIQQEIILSNVAINTDINLSYSEILKPVELNTLTLQKPISLDLNTFSKTFFAQNINVNNDLNLRQSLFYGKTTWMNINCKQQCDFTLNKFLKAFRLSHSVFTNDVTFSGTVYYNNAIIEKNRFNGQVDLSESIFNQGVNFSKVSINDGIDLSNTIAKSDINFNNTMIRNFIDISNVSLDGATINLQNITPLNKKNRIKIYLTNTDLEKINIDYTNFDIAFEDSATYSTKIWTYNKLLEKIKNMGDIESYNRLFIESKQFKYQHNDAFIANFFSQYFWNYGLDTGLPVMWCAAIFLLYCIVNAIIFPQLIRSYASDIKLFSNIQIEDKKTNPIIRFVCDFPLATTLTFVIFIGGFLKIGVQSANFHGKNFLVLVYLVMINVTGFATILAIIQFIF